MTTTSDRRLVGVDAARGLALLGMMAVHVLPAVGKDGGVTVAHAIAGGRSAATFAVMAGVGLALLTGGTNPYRDRRWAAAAAGLVVRAAAIGAVGLLLGLVDSRVAVILAYYALLFVVAIPLLPLRARPLFALALTVACLAPVLSHLLRDDNLVAFTGRNPTFATLLDTPGELIRALFLTGYYPVLAWTAYLCAGLAAGRLPLRERRTAAWLFGGGVALAVAAATTSWLLLGPLGGHDQIAATLSDPAKLDTSLELGLYGNTPPTTWWWLAVVAAHSSTPLDLLHTIGVALGLLGAMLLIASTARSARALLSPLAAAGSMTLSLYTAHVLLLTSGVLPRDRDTSYAVQVVAAVALAWLWRRFLGRGPLERAVAVLATPVRQAVLRG
ncbi:MAG: heparan-alpha-glucosaminide N-acetyltransferase domain-containing protein [Sporichthyaceae bacterium]